MVSLFCKGFVKISLSLEDKVQSSLSLEMMSTDDITVKDALKLLIVDDDKELCLLVAEYLEPFGYQVESAHTGPDGLEVALKGNFDAVLLDVMLPGMDGFSVLGELRSSSQVPVLMLTARGEETDRIVGLELGADDYLPKTFSTRELLARIRAVTRRARRTTSKTTASNTRQTFVEGELVVNSSARSVSLGGSSIELTPVEMDLLICLISAKGTVMPRDQLFDRIAGREYEVFDRSIDVHISSLRKKLLEDPKKPRFIKTVRSVGYMFLPQEDKEQ